MAESDHGLPASVLAELEEALAAATAGPWGVGGIDLNVQRYVEAAHTEVCICLHHCVGSLQIEMEANARLIALARNHLPALLAENKRMREALKPFAKMAEAVDASEFAEDAYPDEVQAPCCVGGEIDDGPPDAIVTVGHLRRARAALGATHDQ